MVIWSYTTWLTNSAFLMSDIEHQFENRYIKLPNLHLTEIEFLNIKNKPKKCRGNNLKNYKTTTKKYPTRRFLYFTDKDFLNHC